MEGKAQRWSCAKHTHIHTIPEAQVGALNTISVVSFGLVPYTARNSSLLSFPPHYSTFFNYPLLSTSYPIYFSLLLHHILSSTICSFSFSLPLCFFVLSKLLPPLSLSPQLITSHTLSVPAYGLGSLSSDEGGVSGVVHTLAGEGDWMVDTGLLHTDDSRMRQTVWWAC